MKKSQDDVDLKMPNMAEILRSVTETSEKGVAKILKKAQKAAANGKSFIKIKCDAADYRCVEDYNYHLRFPCSYGAPVDTITVAHLRELGFTLKGDKDISFWGGEWLYYITIYW